MKKLPPYSKPLHDLIRSGNIPTNSINIWIGNRAWKKAQLFSNSYPSRTIALPPWQSANDFIWPVKQCDLLIHDTGYADIDYIDELAYILYQHDAKIIRCINSDFSLNVFHKE